MPQSTWKYHNYIVPQSTSNYLKVPDLVWLITIKEPTNAIYKWMEWIGVDIYGC